MLRTGPGSRLLEIDAAIQDELAANLLSPQVGVILYWSNTCHYNRKTYYSKGINPPVTVSQNYARGCGSNTQHRHDVAQAKKRLWENQMTVGLGLARWTDVPDFLGLVTPVAIQSVVETLEHWQIEMGASCTYSSHVKSHAAHSPRVDVRVRLMMNPSYLLASRRWRWGVHVRLDAVSC